MIANEAKKKGPNQPHAMFVKFVDDETLHLKTFPSFAAACKFMQVTAKQGRLENSWHATSLSWLR
jgi:hypothetical protein